MGGLDILWAGWRRAYVEGLAEPPDGCLFCLLPTQPDAEALILRRGRHAFAVLNRFPYVTGHLMVGPLRHVAELADLTGPERGEIWELLVAAQEAVDRSLAPDAYNMGANLGRVAGAGVPAHLHFHLVPRWSGDTNFMSVIGGTRVLPEDLEDTLARLRAVFPD